MWCGIVRVMVICLMMMMGMSNSIVEGGSWCVAKIGASEEALQTALDSVCGGGGGADCAPIQPDGLCYIPNTLQAHASYAFNSFYQRNARAPNACLFHAGTGSASTIAQTDPSYGSCVYPSSATASTAGVTNTTVTTPSMPNVAAPTTTTPIHGGDGAGMNPLIPENSTAPSNTITTSFLVFLLILCVRFSSI